jgi:hypothetical protein
MTALARLVAAPQWPALHLLLMTAFTAMAAALY